MEAKRCFEPGCMLEIECSCQCTLPGTLCCCMHLSKHVQLPNKVHIVNSIFVESCEGTREAILSFLEKEMARRRKTKVKIINSFSSQVLNSMANLKELIKGLDSSLDEFRNYYTKISQAKKLLKSEQDPVLELLGLHPDEAVGKIKSMIPDNPDWYNNATIFCGFNEKIEKMIECFIKDKFETYLDKRIAKIERAIKKQNKSISLANSEIANTKNSICELIGERNKIQRSSEDTKEEINLTSKSEISLTSTKVTNKKDDLSLKLKESKSQAKNINPPNLADMKADISNKLEKEPIKANLAFQSNVKAHDSQVIRTYRYNVNAFYPNTKIYNFVKMNKGKNFIIFDTESKRKEIKALETNEILDTGTAMAQLPNGGLFCYGKKKQPSGISLIIDKDYKIQDLPSGIPCCYSSAIYFSESVYCFGGGVSDVKWLNVSRRFDLNLNQWIHLAPMPKDAGDGSSIIFNGNILIAWWYYQNLLRYSVDNNSFATIPYEFASEKRKILINWERLFLIECQNGFIYESEIGSDIAWRRIADSVITIDPYQVYYSYNKEEVYIGCNSGNTVVLYFKFNLNEKSLIKL